MKLLYRFLSLVILSGSVLLSSCDKDEDPTPKDLLLGSWSVTDIDLTIKVGNQTFVDYLIGLGYSAQEAQIIAVSTEADFESEMDGKIEFKKDGSYTASDDNGANPSNGTWELSADAKKLTIDKGTSDETIFDVVSLSASSMSLTSKVAETEPGFPTTTLEFELDLRKN